MATPAPTAKKKNPSQTPKGTRYGGRTAGTPNVMSMSVKENILAVFNRLDGTAGMARWARENQTEFYKLYAKLLPIQVNATVAEVAVPADLSDFGDAELATLAALHAKLTQKEKSQTVNMLQ
jgi:hypothetical protein